MTQSDEMQKKFTKRKLELANEVNNLKGFAKNKTSVDCVIEHVKC